MNIIRNIMAKLDLEFVFSPFDFQCLLIKSSFEVFVCFINIKYYILNKSWLMPKLL